MLSDWLPAQTVTVVAQGGLTWTAEPEEAIAGWVTLAVEPDRVSELLAAVAQGTVSLVAPGSGVDESLGTGSNDSSAAEDAKDSEGVADSGGADEVSDAEADAQDMRTGNGGDAR